MGNPIYLLKVCFTLILLKDVYGMKDEEGIAAPVVVNKPNGSEMTRRQTIAEEWSISMENSLKLLKMGEEELTSARDNDNYDGIASTINEIIAVNMAADALNGAEEALTSMMKEYFKPDEWEIMQKKAMALQYHRIHNSRTFTSYSESLPEVSAEERQEELDHAMEMNKEEWRIRLKPGNTELDSIERTREHNTAMMYLIHGEAEWDARQEKLKEDALTSDPTKDRSRMYNVISGKMYLINQGNEKLKELKLKEEELTSEDVHSKTATPGIETKSDTVQLEILSMMVEQQDNLLRILLTERRDVSYRLRSISSSKVPTPHNVPGSNILLKFLEDVHNNEGVISRDEASWNEKLDELKQKLLEDVHSKTATPDIDTEEVQLKIKRVDRYMRDLFDSDKWKAQEILIISELFPDMAEQNKTTTHSHMRMPGPFSQS